MSGPRLRSSLHGTRAIRFAGWQQRREGSRLAREYRLKQVESIESGGLEHQRIADPDDFDETFETRTSDLQLGSRALQNIFDLVPDHVIPVWVQELPDLPWEDDAKQKAERGWVVSAHRTCNSRRKKRLENADFLLFVYSRYLFPRLALSEKEKILAMLAFAEVLHRLEIYKEGRELTELGPDGRAI